MTIEMREWERHQRGEQDLTCPCFVCDHCGDVLVDDGLVLWDSDIPQRLLFVHRGRCDRAVSADRGHMSSRDMHEFLVQLVNNYKTHYESGVDMADLEAVSRAIERGSDG
jgi:hypothetical protein